MGILIMLKELLNLKVVRFYSLESKAKEEKMKKSIYIRILLCLIVFMGGMSCSKGQEWPYFKPGSSSIEIEVPEPDVPQEAGEGIKDANYSSLTSENHPRLFVKDEQMEQIRTCVNTNSDVAALHQAIMNIANSEGLSTEEIVYKLDASNKRILSVSQNSLLRIFACAYAYRFTKESKYLEHAESDILTVCNFENWNARKHFLDAGEMAAAVGIGYDWLYNHLKESTKELAEKCLRDYAFIPAQNKVWNLNFYNANNNWNQVCNGGLITAAIATYEKNPSVSKDIIEKGVLANARAVKYIYYPDGNYPEGPGYWDYGTTFQVLLLSSLESAFKTDFGISGIEGFEKTGDYMNFSYGTGNHFFNFSDNMSTIYPSIALWYFADKFKNPSLIYNELKLLKSGKYKDFSSARLLPLLMSYALNIDFSQIFPPTEKIFTGNGENPIVMIHSKWGSEEDKYLGVKAGYAGASHGHMDAGSFMYEDDNVRWSMDYNREGYAKMENGMAAIGGSLWDMDQSSMRWDVYRYNNLHHSTLTINGAKHLVEGKASITKVINNGETLGAELNLTEVFKNEAESVTRTIQMEDGDYLVVIDEVKAKSDKAAKVHWTLVTEAVPTVTIGNIKLSYGSKVRYLRVSAKKSTVKLIKFVTDPKAYGTKISAYESENKSVYECGWEGSVAAGQTAIFTTIIGKE